MSLESLAVWHTDTRIFFFKRIQLPHTYARVSFVCTRFPSRIVINMFQPPINLLHYFVCQILSIDDEGHRKICVPPAVTCEQWLRASCELKRRICGHLRADQFSCVQMCEYLRAPAYLLRGLFSCLRVPVEARTCSGCDENKVILPFYYVAMYLIFWN